MSDSEHASGSWIGPWPAGWVVEHVRETGSTNADLLAVAGERPDRTVLATDHQTAGRGRLDRRWDAPPGVNLLVSILFRSVPDDPTELTRRVGVAVTDAVRSVDGRSTVLKWPNDVLLEQRKLAGILAQRAPNGAVVVGLGLNVGWAPEGAIAIGNVATPPEVLRSLLTCYDALPADIGPLYRERLDTIGRRVRVELPGSEVVGTALDVEDDGALVVLDDCAVTHRIDVGDVVHLRPG